MPHDSAISFLGIYPKETKAKIQGAICAPEFIAATFTKGGSNKLPSTEEFLRNLEYIIVLSEISKSKKRHISV